MAGRDSDVALGAVAVLPKTRGRTQAGVAWL